MGDLFQSAEYLSFRSSIPLRHIVVDSSLKGWQVYDCGPKTIKCPLICLPPVSGTADVFFKQSLALSAKGVRVIAAVAPVLWTVNDWCESFKKLLDALELDKVHIFGASLGGYLAQKFAEHTYICPRVASLVLCNTFTDTAVFNNHNSASMFWLMPSLALKHMIMGSFDSEKVDSDIMESIDFVVDRFETLKQSELASRLTLNCSKGYVEAHKLKDLSVTIIDVFDKSALCNNVIQELYKCYPQARMAHLKSGGNFPYLSRSTDVNLYIQIHLGQFDGTNIAASELPLIQR